MSGLDAFLGTRAVTPPPVEEASTAEVAAATAAAPSSDEPEGVVEITTPSGIEVYYQAAPKRLYRLRDANSMHEKYREEFVQVPSMSEITKILDKPGLVHWAEKIGINLVQELLRTGAVDLEYAMKEDRGEDPDPTQPWWKGAHLQEIGKQKQLTNYFIKDAAASRGNSVHGALEGYAMSGALPDPDVFEEGERGFIVGLNKFLSESGFEPRMSEVIVGSTNHEVAGRFDLLGDFPKTAKLIYHLTPKNERRREFGKHSAIIDLKTSKGVYEEYHLQVAGYKGVLTDSGYEEPELGYVLRVTREGRYELVQVQAVWEDFWFLRGLYDGIQRLTLAAREAAK